MAIELKHLILPLAIGLVGCGSSDDDDDSSADIERAKSFVNSFNRVTSAVAEKETDIESAVTQMNTDLESVSDSNLQAAMVGVQALMFASTDALESGITRDVTTDDITAVDYSQIPATTDLSTVSFCDVNPCDITATGSLAFNSNTQTFSVTGATVTYTDDLGADTSTSVDFSITLPSSNLDGNNTLAITLNDISSTSGNVVVDVDASASIGIENSSTLTLNGFLGSATEAEMNAVSFNLSGITVTMGNASFSGSLAMTADSDGPNDASLSGTWTNSLAESFSVTVSIDSFSNNETSTTTTQSSEGQIDGTITMGFDLADGGTLDVTFDLAMAGSSQETNSESGHTGEYTNTITGALELSVDNDSILINIDLDSEESDSSSQNGYSDTIDETISYCSGSDSSVCLRVSFSDSYSYSNGSESYSESESGGVYVDNDKVGDLAFDAIDGTASIQFTDGTFIELGTSL